MLSKVTPHLEKINIWLIVPYIFLQSFLYFSAYIHSIGGTFYYIVWDPSLFARDIIKTSTIGTATLFYPFVHWLLGENVIIPPYLFLVYLVSCTLIAWAVFLMGRSVSGGINSVALIFLILLLVEKVPIEGAYLGIMRTDYNYQHFTLPFSLFAIYFVLKERYLYFGLLMAISFYFHLKTPAAITIALIPLLIREVMRNPRILLSFILPFIAVIPKVFLMSRSLNVMAGFTPTEKEEYMNFMIHREEMEGSMYFNVEGVFSLALYTLLAFLGVRSAGFVKDQVLRSKIYWCHGGVYFAFVMGTLVRVVDFFYGPLGEIVVLGYSRASVLGLLLTFSTLSLFFYRKIGEFLEKRDGKGLFIGILILFFFAINSFSYFTLLQELTKKFIIKFGFFIMFTVLLLLVVKRKRFKVTIDLLISALLAIALMYVGIKGAIMVRGSYASHYPYAPFVPDFSLFDYDLYLAGQWAQKNTPKDTLFLVSVEKDSKEESFCDEDFRKQSLRSVWCQGFPSTYGSAVAFREWKRRRALLHAYLDKPSWEWEQLLKEEKINFILASKNFVWSEQYEKVYQNSQYVIYKVN